MSRHYQMTLSVTGANEEEKKLIEELFEKEWNWDSSDEDDDKILVTGEGNLHGGEGEEEFTTRIAHAVWKKLGKYLPVKIHATYLDFTPPCETHERGEDDYKSFLEKK